MASDPRALLDHALPPEQDLERDLHTEHQILNMGPSHPATHGTVKFLIELDGETIVDLDIQVGYLHRGFEKEAEHHTYHNVIPYTDRLNYCSAMNNNFAYAEAVEKLLGIELTPRCIWLRTPTTASRSRRRAGGRRRRPKAKRWVRSRNGSRRWSSAPAAFALRGRLSAWPMRRHRAGRVHGRS